MTTDTVNLPPLPHRLEQALTDYRCGDGSSDEVDAAIRSYALLAVQEERLRNRVLDTSDSFCPKCGHNRDRSSVSSVKEDDGRHSCQLCGTAWHEVAIRSQQP